MLLPDLSAHPSRLTSSLHIFASFFLVKGKWEGSQGEDLSPGATLVSVGPAGSHLLLGLLSSTLEPGTFTPPF